MTRTLLGYYGGGAQGVLCISCAKKLFGDNWDKIDSDLEEPIRDFNGNLFFPWYAEENDSLFTVATCYECGCRWEYTKLKENRHE